MPAPWFDGLATIPNKLEDGVCPEGLHDAHIAMIPKADGDAAPLDQRPLCVLPVVCRLWASFRLAHLGEWFSSWVPHSVFTGGGRSSVQAWCTAC